MNMPLDIMNAHLYCSTPFRMKYMMAYPIEEKACFNLSTQIEKNLKRNEDDTIMIRRRAFIGKPIYKMAYQLLTYAILSVFYKLRYGVSITFL